MATVEGTLALRQPYLVSWVPLYKEHHGLLLQGMEDQIPGVDAEQPDPVESPSAAPFLSS